MIENKEKRYIVNSDQIETRAIKDDNDNMILEGYASIFNSRSRMLAENGRLFYEIIENTAFNEVLQRNDIDVLLTYQHNGNEVLARYNPSKGVNTLELSVDDTGLKFRAVLANTSTARDTWENVRSGNLYECSFVFTVDSDGERWEKDNEGNHIRYINKVSGLYDCSICVNGAYEGTSIAVASRKLEEIVANESEGDVIHDDVVTGLEDDTTEDNGGDDITPKEYNERDIDKLKIELLKLKK